MIRCRECEYYSFEDSTCCRRESENFMGYIQETDACSKFSYDDSDSKTCRNCKYGEIDDFEDIICVNDASEYVTDYVYDDTCCDEWEEK